MLLSVISLLLLMLYLMLGNGFKSHETKDDGKITEKEKPVEPGPESSTEQKETETSREEEEAESVKTDIYKLYVIIDDAGNNPKQILPFLNFPGKLAIAVLPQLAFSEVSARQIEEAGKDVLLHFPMEAENGSNPGPGAIYENYDEETILAVIEENLRTVPGAIGVNNHQGSRITADRAIMKIFLKEIHKKDLFFIDSRTTVHTQAAEIAAELGMPFAERNVFLDNRTEKEYIRKQIEEGTARAEKTGQAVMIGHVQNAVLAEVLAEMYPELIKHGFVFESLKQLTEEDTQNDSTRH